MDHPPETVHEQTHAHREHDRARNLSYNQQRKRGPATSGSFEPARAATPKTNSTAKSSSEGIHPKSSVVAIADGDGGKQSGPV